MQLVVCLLSRGLGVRIPLAAQIQDYLQGGTVSLEASADAHKRILDDNASNPLASVQIFRQNPSRAVF